MWRELWPGDGRPLRGLPKLEPRPGRLCGHTTPRERMLDRWNKDLRGARKQGYPLALCRCRSGGRLRSCGPKSPKREDRVPVLSRSVYCDKHCTVAGSKVWTPVMGRGFWAFNLAKVGRP